MKKTRRLMSIDALRGLMVILMALDHVRHYWYIGLTDPTDLATTTVGLFMTRWITHLCAPIFFLLSGVGIYLAIQQGKSKSEISKYLIVRGLIMIALEVTFFSRIWVEEEGYILLQVIWALGCSMIVMAGLIWLKDWIIGLFGFVLVFGHNLLGPLDGIIGSLLHQGHSTFIGFSYSIIVLYPLIPWIGVMALGYLFARVLLLDYEQRKKWLLGLGSACLIVFGLLRYGNLYGDPIPWQSQKTLLFSVLSFINCEKYPPSLLFLAMTLGIGFFILLFIMQLENNGRIKCLTPLIHFGRVPMFFYLIHLPLIFYLRTFFKTDGVNLMGIYELWIGVLIILYPICWLYLLLKSKKKWRILSYF